MSMSTPLFSTNLTHCLTFDYNIYASEESLNLTNSPGLQVYIRSKHYMLSGQQIWSSVDVQEGTARVSIWNNPLLRIAKLDFVGLIGDSGTTKINISNVIFENGTCDDISEIACQVNEFRCRDRQECINVEAVCNGTSECSDRSDEEPPACGESPCRP